MSALNRDEKAALAQLAISQVANLVEFWTELGASTPELAGVDPRAAAEQLARWMGRLPGSAWDDRLPDPSTL